MNREKFGEMMDVFANIYEKVLTDKQMDIYYKMLKEIPDKEVDETIEVCLKKYMFFPKIGEIWNAWDSFRNPYPELPPLTPEEYKRCGGK